MTLNISCLSTYSPIPSIPSIPLLTNVLNNIVHLPYKPTGHSLIEKISSSVVDSSFPLHDVELFLKMYLKKDGYSLNVSSFLKTKSISSILTYTIISTLLFLIFSTIFYTISYFKFKKIELNIRNICAMVLILINLFLLIEMIVLINDVSKTKTSLNKSLNVIHEEIYPKNIVEYIDHLIKQLNQIDEYSIKQNSIIVLGVKSITMKALNRLLNEKYFIEDLVNHVNHLDQNFHRLRDLVAKNTVLKTLFDKFTISYTNMMKDLHYINEKVCHYSQPNATDIDKQIITGLNIVHEKIQSFLQFLDQQVLKKLNNNFLQTKQVQQIQRYISLIEYLIIFIILFITIVPFMFILIMTIYIFFQWKNQQSIRHEITSLDSSYSQNDNQQRPSMDSISNNRSSSAQQLDKTKDYLKNPNGSKSSFSIENILSKINFSSRFLLYSIRFVFGLITILIIILSVITGGLYGLNLLFQGSCRVAHCNQPFLISLVTANFLNPINNFDINAIFLNMISDCDKNIHFTEQFLKNFFEQLDDKFRPIIEDLNDKIFQEFLNANKKLNVISDLHGLNKLASLSGFTDIANQITYIEKDVEQIHQILEQVVKHNSTLSPNFIKNTFKQFEMFLKPVIQSAIDACPLPIDIILKTDQLICHETVTTMNGLWLWIFLFMFAVIVGLCIFGLGIYKQLY